MKILYFILVGVLLTSNLSAQNIKEIQLEKFPQTVPNGKVWFINNLKTYKGLLVDGIKQSGTMCNAAFHSNPNYLFGITYYEPNQSTPKTLGFTFSDASTLDNITYQLKPKFFIEDNMDIQDALKNSLTSSFKPKEIIFYAGTSVKLTSCISKLTIFQRDINEHDKMNLTKQEVSKSTTISPNKAVSIQMPNVIVEAQNFSEGLAGVACMVKGEYNLEKKYSYINEKGDFIFYPKYDKVEPFSDGFGLATLPRSIKGGVEFINKNGVNEFEGVFNKARSFKNGFAAIQVGNKWGLINIKGDVVGEIKYDEVGDFINGFAAVATDKDGWGFIDTSGREVIIPQFKVAGDFSEGLALVATGNYRDTFYKYINEKGQIKFELKDNMIPYRKRNNGLGEEFWQKSVRLFNFTNGMIVVTHIPKSNLMPSSIVLIDKQGKNISKIRNADGVSGFNEDIFAIKLGSSNGFSDANGKTVLYPQFDDVDVFYEGLARVYLRKNCGFVDKSGNVVINKDILKGANEIKTSHPWTDVSNFHEGLAWVKTNGKYGFIDKNGNWVFKPEFEEVGTFRNGIATVKFSNREGWNFIDKQGKILYPNFK
ncbi:WG repeat-containing protein [Pedobacter sp. UBA4863]|uniref:WG repeat-containing protein n=1 Tax=Pedobacter sp. UBA4863 TaxID=1947060 RepID=UPI0025F5344D|nr:WG repeat-containing protein [Pedobacter sp. UBA4863]